MKKIVVIALILLSLKAKSQEEKNFSIYTRAGLNTLNEINLYGEKKFSKTTGIVSSIAYKPGIDNGFFYGNKFRKEGFELKVGLGTNLTKKIELTYLFFYQRTQEDNLKEYGGGSKGSDYTQVKELSEKLNTYGLKVYGDFNFSKRACFYIGLGIGEGFYSGILYREGVGINLKEVNESYSYSGLRYFLDLGFRINFVK